MAKFPIRYSQQAPPQQSGVVRSSVDVRTGEGLAGESLARAGEKLAGFGFEMMAKIQKAEDDVEFSARKREIDSYYSDGYVTAGEVGTPEAQIKIHTEVDKNVQSVSSRNSRVNTALQIYKNNVAAQWGKTYGIQQLNLRKKNIGTQADSNMQHALTNGDLKGYTDAMNAKVSIGLATPAQAKTALEQFENNSTLEQIKRQIFSNDPEQVGVGLERLEKMNPKEMTSDQIVVRNKWLKVSKSQVKHNTDEVLSQMYISMDKGSNLSPIDKQTAADNMKRTLAATKGLSREDAKIVLKDINLWVDGEERETNNNAYLSVRDAIGDFRLGAITPKQLDAKLQSVRFKVSPKDFKSLGKDIEREIPARQSQIMAKAEKYARQRIAPSQTLLQAMVSAGRDTAKIEAYMSGAKYQADLQKMAHYTRAAENLIAKDPDSATLKEDLRKLAEEYATKTPQQLGEIQAVFTRQDETVELPVVKTREEAKELRPGEWYYIIDPVTGKKYKARKK